jgi:hypothetical protein
MISNCEMGVENLTSFSPWPQLLVELQSPLLILEENEREKGRWEARVRGKPF